MLLTFDEETTQRLQNFKEELYSFDIDFQHNHPHITIANYPGIKPAIIKKYATHFFNNISAFSLVFSKVALINEHLLVIEPIDNPQLNEIHHNFHTRYSEYANEWTNKEKHLFRPHITIHYDEKRDFQEVLDYLTPRFKSFTGSVNGVEISEVRNDGFKILQRIALKSD